MKTSLQLQFLLSWHRAALFLVVALVTHATPRESRAQAQFIPNIASGTAAVRPTSARPPSGLSAAAEGGSGFALAAAPIAAPPPADLFANRQQLIGSLVTVRGTNAAATKEPGEPNHEELEIDSGGKSVWWTWTAPATGRVTLQTTGSDFDTVLAVYTNTVLAELARVAANDNDLTRLTETTSLLTFPATQGVSYQIAVDGWTVELSGIVASGEIVLSLELDALPTVSWTKPSPSQVFRGLMPIELCATVADYGGAIRTVEFLNGTAVIGTVTPTPGLAGPSEVCFTWRNAPLGTNLVVVRVTDQQTNLVSTIPLRLVVELGNDFFAQRIPVVGVATNISGNNVGATQEEFERLNAGARHPQNPGGKSVWYQWTCPSNGLARVTIDFAQAPWLGLVTVFAGNSVESLQRVASNDREEYIQTVEFTNAIPGTVYSIAVDAYRDGDGGIFENEFKLDLRVGWPPTVQLLSPANPTLFCAGTNLLFAADARDLDGAVVQVEYLLNNHVIGVGTGRRWNFSTNYLPAGQYWVEARATDNIGYTTTTTNAAYLDVIVTRGTQMWQFSTGANRLSIAPAIDSDGNLYFGSDAGFLYAVDRHGAAKWAQPFKAGGAIESSPALAPDGTIYFGSVDGCIYALKPDGSLKWRFMTAHFVSTSPVIAADGTVYALSWDGNLYALNSQTGIELWSHSTGVPLTISPAIGLNGAVYFGSADTNLVWRVGPGRDEIHELRLAPGERIKSAPAIDSGGNVYFTTTADKVYAVSPTLEILHVKNYATSGASLAIGTDGALYIAAGGLLVLNLELTLRTNIPISGFARSAPALALDGAVYIAADNAKLYGIYPDNSTTNWSIQLGSLAGEYLASPTIGIDGTIYQAYRGDLIAIKGTQGLAPSPWPQFRRNHAQTANAQVLAGDVLWQFPTGGPNAISPAIGPDGTVYYLAGPVLYASNPDGSKTRVIAEGLIWDNVAPPLVGPDGTLYLAAHTGGGFDLRVIRPNDTNIVQFPTGTRLTSAMALDRTGTVYYGGKSVTDGSPGLYAFGSDGKPKENWPFKPGGAGNIATPAIGADGTVYFGSENHTIYAVNANGTQRWFYDAGNPIHSSPALSSDGAVYFTLSGDFGRALLALDTATGSQRWKVPGPGGPSSPVIGLDGTIYAGSAYNGVYAISPQGTKVWQKSLNEMYVQSTPTMGHDGMIYFGGQDGKVYALTPQGEVAWARRVSFDHFGRHSATLGPDGTLYIGFDSGRDSVLSALVALKTSSRLADSPWPKFQRNLRQTGDASTLPGDKLWQFAAGASQSAVSLAGDDTLYVGADHLLYSLRPDGLTNWVFPMAHGKGWQSTHVISADGRTIFTSCVDYRADPYGTILYAVSSQGERIWDRKFLGSPNGISPALGHDGTVYFGTEAGVLHALAPASGEILWTKPIGASLDLSPAIGADGSIYLGADKTNVVAIDPDGKTIRWRQNVSAELTGYTPALGLEGRVYVSDYGSVYAFATLNGAGLWTNRVGYTTYSSPIVAADGTVYVGSSHERFNVWAFDGETGNVRWKVTLPPDYSYSTPTLGEDRTLYLGVGGSMYAIRDAGTHGEMRWEFYATTPHGLTSSPVLSRAGTVYIGSYEGSVYAFKASSGPAQGPWPTFRGDAKRSGRQGGVGIPPVIRLVSPAGGDSFVAPVNISLRAEASDADGRVSRIEYLDGASVIAVAQAAPFSAIWTNAPPGAHLITARAIDDTGLEAVSAVSAIVVNTSTAPANDGFAAPMVLDGRLVVTTASNARGSSEPNEPEHAGLPGEKSVWFAWRAPASGVAALSLAGSRFDTLVGVYTGATLATLVPIASDDDAGGNGTSQTSFVAVGGTLYLIAVDGFGGASGFISLRLDLNIPPLISLTDPLDGAAFNAPADIVLAAEAKDAEGRLNRVEFFSDAGLVGARSVEPYRVIWTAVEPRGYSIWAVAVDSAGLATTSAPVTIRVEQPAPLNDRFVNAIRLSGGAPSASGSNRGGSVEAGEPAPPGRQGGRSVWWTWTALHTGEAVVSTRGSSFDTLLAVYSGSTLATLTLEAADDDSGGNSTSELRLPVAEGKTYYITIDGFAGGVGEISLALHEIVKPVVSILSPANGAADFLAPAAITLAAKATDLDGRVLRVTFQANEVMLGDGTEGAGGSFTYRWVDVPAGNYELRASAWDDAGNTGQSAAIAIKVQGAAAAPRIGAQPKSLILPPGGNGQLVVGAEGTPPLRYQWRHNGTVLPGATNATFSIPFARDADAGEYTVQVANLSGSVMSTAVKVVVATAPAIVNQPSSRFAAAGESVTFAVVVQSTLPVRYAWRFSGVPIPGATESVFRLAAAASSDMGVYSVAIENDAGTMLSAEVSLTIEGTGGDRPPLAHRDEFWIPDGPVYAMVETNGILYLGGSFQQLGPNLGHAGLLDNANGQASRGFPRINGPVLAVAADGSGGWFVGGSFTSVGGINRTNLAHVRADATLDPSWNPDANRPVFALALGSGTLYVGGQFTLVGGQPRSNLAALDPVTGLMRDWPPQTDGPVYALAAGPTSVYVGGLFSQVGGITRKRIAQIDDNGRVSGWNPNANGAVFALVQAGNILYAGGEFSNIGGLARNRIAALDAVSGDAVPAWDANAGGRSVRALAVSDGLLFAGGDFIEIGGQPRRYVAALDANGRAAAWRPEVNSSVLALAAASNRVYVAGQFTHANNLNRGRLAAFDIQTGQLLDWNPRANQRVYALAAAGAEILVGGDFITLGGVDRSHLAALDIATGLPLDWIADCDRPVRALGTWNDVLVAGGEFDAANGQPRAHLAAFSRSSGEVLDWHPDPDDTVLTILMADSKVFLGGNFTQIGSQSRNRLAALDRNGNLLPGWNPGANGSVYDLAFGGGFIYVAGDFSSLGGGTRRNLGAVDSASGILAPWNPIADRAVQVVELAADGLLAGGAFTEIGGQPRQRLALLDLHTAAALPWAPTPTNLARISVDSIVSKSAAVYVGGVFNGIGGAPRQNLALLDSVAGRADIWGPAADGPVLSLLSPGPNTLYVAGDFDHVGREFRPYLAVFTPRGLPLILRQPRSLTVASGSNAILSVLVRGLEPMALQWRVGGVPIPSATNISHTLLGVRSAALGLYDVVVSNVVGVVVSETARITILDPPSIVEQPRNLSVAPGANVSLSVTAVGSAPLRFQWQRNGIVLPGETSASLLMTSVQPSNSGRFRVLVANDAGFVQSETAIVQVAADAVSLEDRFADRSTNAAALGTVTGFNTAATREPREPFHAGKPASRSVWLAWRAPITGVVTFDTIGSNFDTLLAVYTGQSVNALTEVASDEDQGGFFASRVRFNATQGSVYQIAIDGFGGATGSVVLNWHIDPESEELPRILRIVPGSQSVKALGAKVTQTVELANAGAFTYQWFFNGQIIPDATAPTLVIGSFQPAQVGAYRIEVGNGRRSVSSSAVAIEFGPVAAAFTRDKFKDLVPDEITDAAAALDLRRGMKNFASVSAGAAGTHVLDNFGSSTEQNEPLHAGTPGGASRWYRLTMEASGTLQLDTLGSDIDTLLAVYTGNGLLDLRLIASDNNSAPDGIRSLLILEAVKGDTYLIAVDGVDGATGSIQLNWRLGSPPIVMVAPPSAAVAAGSPVALNGTVSGVPAPSLQWSLDGVDLPAKTNAVLHLDAVTLSDTGRYRLRAQNFAGTISSAAIAVSILQPASLRLTGIAKLADGTFQIRMEGGGANLVIEASTNLLDWLSLFTNSASGNGEPGIVEFNDNRASAFPLRFYRARGP